jgi:hypothetical protein
MCSRDCPEIRRSFGLNVDLHETLALKENLDIIVPGANIYFRFSISIIETFFGPTSDSFVERGPSQSETQLVVSRGQCRTRRTVSTSKPLSADMETW